MSRELKAVVIVDGVVYGPGYETPDAKVAARIKNPAAWGEPVDSDEGHGLPGNHEQMAAGLLPHTPVQPNQVVMAEPAGDGGVNPLLPAAEDTGSSAVPAGAATPAGVPSATAPMILTSNPGMDEGDAEDPAYRLEDQTEITTGFDAEAPAEPPRSGKGATTAAWRTYAEQLGVAVDDDAERGDIIARLKADGHIQ